MRRGKSYVVVMSRGRDPLTGKRRRDWHSGFRTRSEAVRAEAELASRMIRGLYVEPTRLRLGDYLIETWLPSISETVRESALSSYSHNVRRHIVPHLGHVAVQELSGPDLNRLYAHLRRAGRLDGRGGLAPKTVHYIHTILHRALRDAVRWNLVSRNIAEAADPPKTSRAKEFRTWSRSELREFLAGVATDRLFAAFVTAASTGLRRGELLGLRWSDVDLDGRRLSIRQSLISIEYEVRISEPKTSRGRRTVAIDPATTDALRAHRKNQTLERLSAEGWPAHDLVFTEKNGKPIHPDRFSKIFKNRVKASNLPRIRLHDLRHTHATLALEAGWHPKVVSERLGHASVVITLDTYSHVSPTLQEQLADGMMEAVLSAPPN